MTTSVMNESPSSKRSSATALRSRAEIQAYCIDYLATVTNQPTRVADPEADFASLGLDSATAAALIFELEERVGIDLAPSLMFEYPSTAKLSKHLYELIQKGNVA